MEVSFEKSFLLPEKNPMVQKNSWSTRVTGRRYFHAVECSLGRRDSTHTLEEGKDQHAHRRPGPTQGTCALLI